MLQIDFGTIHRSEERRLAAGTTGVLEGQALVTAYENGELVVKPSSGTANEVFYGVAISSVSTIKSLTKVEVLTTPAVDDDDNPIGGGTRKQVTLSNTPSGTLKVYEGSNMSGTEQVYANATPAANKYNRNVGTNEDGKTVTLFKDGTTYTFVYRYVPTTLEVLNLQGDAEPGTHVSDVTETIGVITAGEVYTGEWVTTVAWSGTSDIHTASSGRFSTASVTGQSSIGIVTKVPDSETGLLGFRFSV